jgi:5-formyltetrahydrofolate cyclo-ligase
MTDSGAVADAKRGLRARMRDVRVQIAADVAGRAARSALICQRVIAAIEPRLTTASGQLRVLLYDPVPGEPELTALAAWCAEQGVATYLPVVDADALIITPGDEDPASLDVVVVPGLAFSYGGERLGQGGGHFDRFLTTLRGDCLRIGVAFHEQVVAELPTAEHDVAVDLVITD